MSENTLLSSAKEFLSGSKDFLRGLGLISYGLVKLVDSGTLAMGMIGSSLLSLALFTCGGLLKLTKRAREVGEVIITLSQRNYEATLENPWIARLYGYSTLAVGGIYLAKNPGLISQLIK